MVIQIYHFVNCEVYKKQNLSAMDVSQDPVNCAVDMAKYRPSHLGKHWAGYDGSYFPEVC